jgi:hypothetical protein
MNTLVLAMLELWKRKQEVRAKSSVNERSNDFRVHVTRRGQNATLDRCITVGSNKRWIKAPAAT